MIEAVLAAARAAPQSAWARIAEAAALLASRDVRDFEAAGWVYAGLLPLPKTAHEMMHMTAIGAAVDGDYAEASRAYDRILAEEPRDALALAVAQLYDYYLGRPQSLLARTTRALAAWTPAMPLNPRDVRAHHALAHVMEMQGRFEEGIRILGARCALWAGAGPVSTHLWWHLALYHLELGRPAVALALYDLRMQGQALSELIDASALLWRLHLAGVALGSRFKVLASRWAPYAEDAHCAFNDLHAMMAFVGAGRWDCAERLLRALPPVAHRIGGSHAQRDVLQLTRAAAAAAKVRLRHAA